MKFFVSVAKAIATVTNYKFTTNAMKRGGINIVQRSEMGIHMQDILLHSRCFIITVNITKYRN